MSLPTPDKILTYDDFRREFPFMSTTAIFTAYQRLYDAYVEALDREAAFTAAMDEFLDDEIVDALDRPKPCLKIMGVVKGDGSIVTKGAI